MRTRILLLAVSCALLAVIGSATAQDVTYVRDGDTLRVIDEHGVSFVVDPDVVSARFLPAVGSLEGAVAQLGDDAGVLAELSVVRSNRLGIVDLRLPEGADPLEVAAALEASGTVEFAEINTYGYAAGVPGDSVPNDPLFGDLWYLENTGQEGGTPGADMSALEAWEIEDGDPSVVVAVIDTGGAIFHPDLIDSLWVNPNEIPDNGVDDDGNGFVDDVHGWDFLNDDNDPSTGFDHGSRVASVVAARGQNGLGVVGLAGGAKDGEGCSFMSVTVASTTSIQSALIDDAILYAADMGVEVINLSYSFPPQITAIGEACDYAWNTAGVFVVSSAGNASGAPVTYPANQPYVVSVASTSRFDARSWFSSSGPKLDLSAPGEDLLVCGYYDWLIGGLYELATGTSFSSPHVAALAALLFSANPDLTNDDVRRILAETATDLGAPGHDPVFGAGRINAAAALEAATSGLGEVDTYGEGLAGVAGVPQASWVDNPQLGTGDFQLVLGSAAASAPAYLVLGPQTASLPFQGGILLVDPTPPAVIVPLSTDDDGQISVPLLLRPETTPPGLELFAQWAVVDAAAVQGFALTAGVEIVVGN